MRICVFCGLAFTNQSALLFNMNIQTEYILIARANYALWFLADKENIILHKKVSVYKIYSKISMNRTHLFLTVTKAHEKAELHLKNFGVLPLMFPKEFNVSQAELISKSYQPVVPVLSQFFLGMGPFKRSIFHGGNNDRYFLVMA